jgi:glycosyltransferase involved in cell wall biosynthesis
MRTNFTTKHTLKRAIVSVINDLVTDQRVHKSCLTLMKAGFEVVLLGRRLRNSPVMPGRPYRCIRMRLLFEKGPLFYAEFNTRLFLKLLFSRSQLLVANDLDTLLPNFVVARLLRKPIIYDSHEYFTETPELVNRPRVQAVWKSIERFVLPKLGWIITVNESIAGLFERDYGIKTYVVRNIPISLNGHCIVKTRAELGLPASKKILVLQGSGINMHRGAEELIEAMRYLPDMLLMIIGSGDVINTLKQMVVDHKIEDQVIFLPRMPFEDMMAYTRLADLGLTLDRDTNINYRFSLPNKLFDYIHAGVPVAATPLPEVKKIVETYNIGTCINASTPETLAAEIRNILQSPDLTRDWKKNLTFAAQELCWENEENVLLKLYEQYN